MKRGGYLLVTVIILSGILMLCSSFISRAIVLQNDSSELRILTINAFYLAESGIEMLKTKLNRNITWETDAVPVTDDESALVKIASGETYYIGDGGFKIIRAAGSNTAYSIGFAGGSLMLCRAMNFQKIDFELPFIKKKWEEF